MTIAHIHDSSGEMGWILNMNLFTRDNTSILCLLLNSVKKKLKYMETDHDWLMFNANFSSISTISWSWCAKNIFGEKQKIKKINGMMGLNFKI
jgi:hypothetical protein